MHNIIGYAQNMLIGAEPTPSAGGAALDQVFLATGVITLSLVGIAWLLQRHRQGRTQVLVRAGEAAERITGVPGWASLPSLVAALSLVSALVGVYWDISLHIDLGRDEGPLANPAHYPILIGLLGVFIAGWLAVFLPRPGERPGPRPVRLIGDTYAPVGGLLIMAAGGFALMSFPLDDVWHRLFGQDVTLWGPTHLMMIGGAVLTLLGQAALLVEGTHGERSASGGDEEPSPLVRARRVMLMGGLLIGVSLLQAEFDFGVPQFRLVFQPLLIAFATGFALVAARIWAGPGGALGAVTMYLVARSALALLVGPVLGEVTPMFALCLVEALAIEACALALGSDRPLRLGLVSGLAVGTVGLASEWIWADLVMPLPWTSGIVPEALIVTPIAGLAGGALGALLGSALRGALPSPQVARATFAAALLALAAVVANGLWISNPRDVTATVNLEPSGSGAEREAILTARIDPPSAAEDAAFLQALAWQGDGQVSTIPERVSEGTYRTTEPVPVGGEWKSNLRLQQDRSLLSIPVYMPGDPAIPAPAVPATTRFERTFVPDVQNLQRERKDDVPGWLSIAAQLMVLFFARAFACLMAWGVARVGRGLERPGAPPDDPAPAPAATPRLSGALGFGAQ